MIKSEEHLSKIMKIKVIVHEAEEGGFWAEVPAIPGCATQAKPLKNFYKTFMKRSQAVCVKSSQKPGFL